MTPQNCEILKGGESESFLYLPVNKELQIPAVYSLFPA